MYNCRMSESGASFGGQPQRKFEGAGGTPGGIGEFLLGVLVAAVGFYLLFSHVQVHSSYWNFFGAGGAGRSFGISLIPLLFGIGILFVNGKSVPGWILAIGGLLLIVAGIIVNLDIYFQPTSLMNTLIMLGLIAAGLGLVVKGLRPHQTKSS
jgi:multisubunit Na+/H+ antiporter MnhF subunit